MSIPIGNALPGPLRFENAPYQREPLDMTAEPTCRRITLMWGAQVGKALDAATPIPTPIGFVAMGDLRVGDEVFDEGGRVCRVELATPLMFGRECFEVAFDDGEAVVCDRDHLWCVIDAGHKIRGVLTHRRITEPLRRLIDGHQRARSAGRTRWAVLNCGPLQMPAAPLPVPPYAYGAWLGDGDSQTGQIHYGAGGEELVDILREEGMKVYPTVVRREGYTETGRARLKMSDGTPFVTALRRAGLLTKQTVGPQYLFASEDQRRALLAGLMDTDGSATPAGLCEFTSKTPALAKAVFHLAASLGLKPREAIKRKWCNHNGRRREAPYHVVTFTAYAADQVFRLARKAARLRPSAGLRPHETRRRRIVDIRPVASRPVRCIQVNSPSKLYLCGRGFVPTHNTQVALCAQGYRIACSPTSQIMMQPSQGDLQTWLQTKLNPLIETNEGLRSRIAAPRSRDGVNNTLMKSYPGGFMMFAWSGSPKTMRGRSAPFAVCDETDGYDRTSEGHPVSLLQQRLATYGDAAQLFEISTPTIKGASWIESAFEAGDRRRYHVVCPHCGHQQHLRWAQVTWDRAADGEHLPETAGYTCEACGVVWSDAERSAAVRTAEADGGGWRAERPWRGHASYHLSELYSRFRTLADIVRSFVGKKAAGDLQTFVNVSLAETWEEQSERLDASALMARAEAFADPVPEGGLVLTCGVDMQGDRLEVETIAWGLGEESWSIDYRVIWGDPMREEVWDDLDEHRSATWRTADGIELAVAALGLDTGGNEGLTQRAYEYCRPRFGSRVYALKGVPGWGRPIVASPSRRTQRRARPVHLFPVGVDEAKLIVSRRFALATTGPGYCHIPLDRDPEWFAQATAERLVTRMHRGFATRSWYKDRPRNEGFDCRVYGYAALKILNPNLRALADRRQATSSDQPPEPDAPGGGKLPTGDASPKRKARAPRRRRGGWVNGW